MGSCCDACCPCLFHKMKMVGGSDGGGLCVRCLEITPLHSTDSFMLACMYACMYARSIARNEMCPMDG